MDRHRWRAAGTALVLAAGGLGQLVAPAVPAAAAAPEPTIVTFAGGPGYGHATEVATRPRGMVKVGTRLYVSDSDQQGWANVVRVIDLESGRTTVAAGVGGGDAYSGDGGPATQANLADPGPLAADDAGNLYIADRRNARIRKVAPDGTITTVAGNGEIGCGGTGGPALSAQVAGISGLAVDRAGNLYISSAPCNVVRRVSPQGIITHFAGNPLLGPDGDGGPAAQANIGNPGTVAVDRSGNVFIEHHGRVRKVDEAGIISTFAGPGSWPPQLGDGGPATAANLHATSMAPDGKGNVYVTDVDFERVRKVDPDGVISTVAGTTGGYWEGVAIGEDGTVYASDIDGVWRFRDGQKALVAGLEDVWLRRTSGDGGPALDAQFAGVADVVGTPNGDVYVADLGNERVRRIAADGVVSTVAGGGHEYPVAGSTMPATAARLHPEWLAVGPEGDLYISSIGQVMRVNGLGVLTVVTGTTGGPVPALGITFDGAGNLYTSHKAEGKVIRRSPDGTVTTVVGCERWNGPSVTACVTMTMDGIPATEATLVEPSGIAVDAAGNLYIAETGLNRIRKVGSDGIITTVAGSSVRGFDPEPGPATERDLSSPRGLRVDATGAVYVADTGYGAIRRVDPDGTMTTVAGTGLNGFAGDGGPASDARLDTPGGLALRPDGSVLVADTRNHRVRLVGPGLSQAPAAPTGVRATGADGSAAVSWKAPAGNGGAAITGYSITASPGGKTVPAAAGATSVVVPGLDNGKRYTFTVRARNANGLGPESPPSNTAAPNRLRAMGWNGSGLLGDGSTTDRTAPAAGQLTGVVGVAAGAYHSLAVRDDGTVWAWGWNGLGQLGTGSTLDSSVPIQVPGLTGVTAVSAGTYHSVALKADGTVWAWGWNGAGQLGDGNVVTRLSPVRVAGLTNIDRIAAGWYHSLAVRNDGTVWAWGWNGVGQLGDGTLSDRWSPVKLGGISRVSEIAAGGGHSLAVGAGGRVWAWGWNAGGQLGIGTTVDARSPVPANVTGIRTVAAGNLHSLALGADGTVRAWGWNGVGEVGDGTAVTRTTRSSFRARRARWPSPPAPTTASPELRQAV